jgi:hypothetical protein
LPAVERELTRFLERATQRASLVVIDGLHPGSDSHRICFERVCARAPLADHLTGRRDAQAA